MVKNIIALILSLVIGLGFINGYQWYCGELVLTDNLYVSLFSICTLIYILNSMLIVGILVNLTKYSYKTIFIIFFSLIILKVGIMIVNNGLPISYFFNIFLAYIGKILGIFLGILYFRKVENIKKGLMLLVLLWILLNIGYPMFSL